MSNPTRIGASTDFDVSVRSSLARAAEGSGLQFDELIELWPLFVRRISFLKMAGLLEIFGLTRDLPGSIVECGVFKGQSLFLFRHLLETYAPGDSLKKIIGFGTFEGFVSLHERDGDPDESRAKIVGGWDASGFLPTLLEVAHIAQEDSYMPRLKRMELVKGDVLQTVPRYVAENPGLRISLLNLDLDLYEPTLIALEHLYPLVVPGGVIVLDEYAMPGFPGESAAFEEYFSGRAPRLQKFPYTPTPGAYFVKE